MNNVQRHNNFFGGLCAVAGVLMGSGVLLVLWKLQFFQTIWNGFSGWYIGAQSFVVGLVMFVFTVVVGAITEPSSMPRDPTYNPDDDH